MPQEEQTHNKIPFSVDDILDPTKFTRKLNDMTISQSGVARTTGRANEPKERRCPTPNESSDAEKAAGACPKKLPLGCKGAKSRRIRTAFTIDQLRILEYSFQNCHYLSVLERHAIASRLRLSDTQVKIWFQNRRTKWRREREGEQPEADYFQHFFSHSSTPTFAPYKQLHCQPRSQIQLYSPVYLTPYHTYA